MRRFRSLIFLLIALLLLGCSRAVYLPRYEWNAEEYRKPGSYKVRLHGWNEYNVRRFSMTDSTVVIEELLVHDDHYYLMRDEMPIVVPLEDVEYIGVIKTNWWATAGFVAFCGVVAALIVGLSHVGPFGQ